MSMRDLGMLIPFIAAYMGCAGHVDIPQDADVDTTENDADWDNDSDSPEVTPATWLLNVVGSVGRQYSNTVLESDDGDVFVGGYHVREEGDGDGWLARIDERGHLRWEHLIGRWVSGLALHPDGGVLVVGHGRLSTQFGALLAYIADDGTPQWQLLWERDLEWPVRIAEIVKTADNTFIIAGTMPHPVTDEPRAWLAELTAEGELLWQRTLLDVELERASLAIAANQDILLATRSGAQGAWLLRLDRQGVPTWGRRLRLDSSMPSLVDVVETSDLDIVVASNYAFRFTQEGTHLRTLGIDTGSNSYLTAILTDSSGSVVFAGATFPDTGPDLLVFGVDQDDEPTWAHVLPWEGCEVAHGITRSYDGSPIISTGGCEHTMVLKLGAEGAFNGECSPLLPAAVSTVSSDVEIDEVEVPVEETNLNPEIAPLETGNTTSTTEVVCRTGLDED